jgi:hypothetical protein
MGKIFDCPSDYIFDEPGAVVVKLILEVPSSAKKTKSQPDLT